VLEFLVVGYLVCWFWDGVRNMIVQGRSWESWGWFHAKKDKES